MRPQQREGDEMDRLKVYGLVLVFLGAVVAANLIVTHYGVSSVYYVAAGLIGLDLITRDRLADAWGTKRWRNMLLMIAAGGAISYYLNRNAATVALASTVAFAGSEGLEAVMYHLFRFQPWNKRAPAAAIFGAVADSVIFISIAFGFTFQVVYLQSMCKIGGAAIWTLVIGYLLAPPKVAPATPESVPEGARA
jgi:uncharacterized PurR-regulated membrane protein YhhQ (DUF165 family)